MALAAINRKAVVIKSPLDAVFAAQPLEYDGLKPGELLVETEYTVVSAGTELAIYKGLESWAPLPFVPGYASVGVVLETASDVTTFVPGDRVFTYGSHASVNIIRQGLVVKPPADLDVKLVPLVARMGQVAFTAVRVSRPELGDFVAVQGLGLVGNLAAQLFTLSGCRVIGIDVSPLRLDAAKACGIDYVVNSSFENPAEAIKKITSGEMSQVVVEATGIPALAGTAAEMAAQNGQVVLLGTPRGAYSANPVDLLMKVHLASSAVTLKGAHEWIYPLKKGAGVKHSMERNVEQLLSLAASGKLHARQLVSHVVSPDCVPDIYNELCKRSEHYFGVVVNWT